MQPTISVIITHSVA